MTKYTIFCVLGLALLIQGAKQWMTPAPQPLAAANPDASPIEPLTKTAHADSLAVPHASSNVSPQPELMTRQPERSFTPGSSFLAQAAQESKDPSPDKTDAAPPSVLVKTQPDPLVIKPTFVPQPREANTLASNPNPAANAVVVNKPETPLHETTDPAGERPRLPAEFATQQAATTAESAALTAEAIGKSSPLPDFTTLKPLIDNRVELQFPTTAMQIPLSPYGQPGQDPSQSSPIANTLRSNEARNPAQVKADSLASHNLMQGAQLAYQSPNFPPQYKLEGKELTLQDIFILTQDRDKRYAMLKAYWKVALAMAEYNWAVEEYFTIQRLEGIGGQASTSHRYIEAAINSCVARVSETRIQTINAQFELLTLMGGQFRTMPLCVDVPLVGTYNTQFEANFPNGRAPTRLRAISQTIDLRRDVVNSSCLAIDTTFNAWAKTAIPLYQRDATEQNAQVVAIGYDQLTRRRRNFLASIREYNNDIAEYALTVLSPSFRPDQLAGYLTRTPSPRPLWNTSAMNPGETAEVPPGLKEARADGQVMPATFAEGTGGDDWSEKTRPALPSVMKQN